MKLCTICGEPCNDGRCDQHRPEKPNKTSRHERGYSNAWSRLSARARKMQPWCSDCGTTEELTADHLRWPATRLDHIDVLCRPCNSRKGAVRSLTPTGADPNRTHKDPRAMANVLTVDRLHFEDPL